MIFYTRINCCSIQEIVWARTARDAQPPELRTDKRYYWSKSGGSFRPMWSRDRDDTVQWRVLQYMLQLIQ